MSQLNTLQTKSIVAPEAPALAEYGLDKPAATITLGTGRPRRCCFIGKAAGEGAVYAKDQSRPDDLHRRVVTRCRRRPRTSANTGRKISSTAAPFNSTRLEVTRNGQTTVFEKTKTKNKEGQDEEKWKQTAPTAADVDQTTVDNLLAAVTAARATSFVDSAAKTGLDKPEVAIALTSDEGKRIEKRHARPRRQRRLRGARRRTWRGQGRRSDDRQHRQVARGRQATAASNASDAAEW